MNIENLIENEPKNVIPKIVDELGRVLIPIDFRKRPLKNNRVVYMELMKNYIILKTEDKNNVATKRSIDELGRLTILKEIREMLGIMPEDYLLIWTYKNNVILKKKETKCIFCEETEQLLKHNGKFICKNCLDTLNKIEAKLVE